MKFIMKTLLVIGLVIAVGAAGRPAGKASLGFSQPEKPAEGNPVSRAHTDIPTARVETVSQDASIRLTGSLAADERSDIASTGNGIVKEVLIERGCLVEKNAVLARVDTIDMENMLAEAEAAVEELRAALGWNEAKQPYNVEDQPGVKMAKAALDLATSNYNRYSDLFKQNAVSKSAYDQIQTEYDASQQRYQQALRQARQLYQSYKTALTRINTLNKAIKDMAIVAPFTGWVAEKYVSVGERVTTNPMGSGARICTLIKVDPLRLMLSVPQQHIAHVREGQEVKFKVDGFPDREFTAQVRYVGAAAESASRSLTVEALAPNPDRVLRPGFFATAELILDEKKTEFAIPASAIVKMDDVSKVYVLRNGKAVEQVVEVGEAKSGRVFVTSGLTADDVVVAAPDRIQDGDTIGNSGTDYGSRSSSAARDKKP